MTPPPGSAGSPRILLVEDDRLNQTLAMFLLQSAGYIVIGAHDAESGLVIARVERPDLILMDLQLPGMDGLAATRQLKADPSTAAIPVVALTGRILTGDADRIRAAGCDGYLAKPVPYQAFLVGVAGRLLRP